MEVVPALATRPSVVHLENPVRLVMEIVSVKRIATIWVTAVKMFFAIQVCDNNFINLFALISYIIEPRTCQDIGCCNNESGSASIPAGCNSVYLYDENGILIQKIQSCSSISNCRKFNAYACLIMHDSLSIIVHPHL